MLGIEPLIKNGSNWILEDMFLLNAWCISQDIQTIWWINVGIYIPYTEHPWYNHKTTYKKKGSLKMLLVTSCWFIQNLQHTYSIQKTKSQRDTPGDLKPSQYRCFPDDFDRRIGWRIDRWRASNKSMNCRNWTNMLRYCWDWKHVRKSILNRNDMKWFLLVWWLIKPDPMTEELTHSQSCLDS